MAHRPKQPIQRVHTGRAPMTEERKQAFLTSLRKHGVFARAARDASPHLSPNSGTPGYSAFRALCDRDASFNSAVQSVMAEVKADVEMEIRRRAMDGTLKPVYQAGRRVRDHDGTPASIRELDNKLLIQYAKRLDPEAWGETVQHKHTHHVSDRWYVSADLIDLLPDHLAASLGEIIDFLHSRSAELNRIEAKPTDVQDAEYTEITYRPDGERLSLDEGERESDLAEFDLGSEGLEDDA